MYPGLTKHTALAPLSQIEGEASMTSDPEKDIERRKCCKAIGVKVAVTKRLNLKLQGAVGCKFV